MQAVESFKLDHTKVKAPYVRSAGLQYNQGAVIQKFDLRLIQPNTDAIPTAGLHTLEHFLSLFLREELSDVIDLSPMGCRTGFYLVLWNEHTPHEVANALSQCLKKVLLQTSVPAATPVECGNYRDHSLFSAKEYARLILEQGIGTEPFIE